MQRVALKCATKVIANVFPFAVTALTFADCVQDLKLEVHHLAKLCANFVLIFAMHAPPNVKNIQHTIVAKSVQKPAKNVLLNAAI